MTNRALDRTLADFIAGALSPPLIMAMVGSLVFFLIEILYAGMYRGSLQWVMFFFVFGAVLIARISMESELAGRSGLYGFVLGGLVWIALRMYVDYSDVAGLAERSGLVNLGLIVLIWWSAQRLTWDCTLLRHQSSGAGAGLLDQAGLEDKKTRRQGDRETGSSQSPCLPVPLSPCLSSAGKKKSKKKKPEEAPNLAGWWARYTLFRQRREQEPRTLGVWVVFFSLAALPLFGLGQSQIPASDLERRSYTFALLAVYVAAGLGLLLTTSFLSLRQYLRQRSVTMPLGITLSWLVLGGLMIAAFLVIGTLLPRPADPQPLWDWTGLTVSREKTPSPRAMLREKENNKGTEPGQKDQADGKKAADGEKAEEPGKTKSDQPGKDAEQKSADGDKEKTPRNEPQQGEEKTEPPPRAESGKGPPPWLAKLLEQLLKLARWLVIAVLVGIFLFVIGRGVLRFLANFTFWAQKLLAFFENLRNGLRGSTSSGEDEKIVSTPRPFASFGNPFRDGKAKYLSPADLVRYSFAALQAFGREQDVLRGIGETPLEYAGRVGENFPWLDEEAGNVASLYARLAYSTDTLTGETQEHLRGFWVALSRDGKEM